MSHSPLRAEIDRALKGLSSEDSARINPDTAEKVFETLLDKLPRVGDERVAIKNSLAKRCIGTQGEKQSQQKTFGAYFRLMVRVMDNREGRAPRARKRRAA